MTTETKQTKTIKPFVNYKEMDIANMICDAPVEKTVPNTTNKYKSIVVNYNFGTADNISRGPFLIQGPTMRANKGLTTKLNQQNKSECSILVQYPLATMKDWISTLSTLHSACAYTIYHYKGNLGLYAFNKDAPESSNFKHPVYFQRDKNTGDIIAGKDPSQFLKVKSTTLFVGRNGKNIDRSKLEGCDITFTPVFDIESIYIGGGKPSLQMKLHEAVILDWKEANSESVQTDLLNELKKDEEQLKKFEEQFLKMNSRVKTQTQTETKDNKDNKDNKAVVVAQGNTGTGLFDVPPLGTGGNKTVNGGLADFLKTTK